MVIVFSLRNDYACYPYPLVHFPASLLLLVPVLDAPPAAERSTLLVLMSSNSCPFKPKASCKTQISVIYRVSLSRYLLLKYPLDSRGILPTKNVLHWERMETTIYLLLFGDPIMIMRWAEHTYMRYGSLRVLWKEEGGDFSGLNTKM